MTAAVADSSVTSTGRPAREVCFEPAESFNAKNSSSLRYVTITFAPSLRNARLTALPRPPVPPATTTTLFENTIFILSPCDSRPGQAEHMRTRCLSRRECRTFDEPTRFPREMLPRLKTKFINHSVRERELRSYDLSG